MTHIVHQKIKITTRAIAVGIATIGVAVSANPMPPKVNSTFICLTETTPPKTVAYLPEMAEPSPILNWYPNYLLSTDSANILCQQVSKKLQTKYVQGQPIHLAYQEYLDRWDVCLVSELEQECKNENSEILFSLNKLYKDTPKCMMEDVSPQNCKLRILNRGPLLSVPAGQYKPRWWSWFFK